MRAPCERCGRARNARNGHESLCGTCSRDHGDIAYTGQWVRRGLIMVPTVTGGEDAPDGPEHTTTCADCGGPCSRGTTRRCRACYELHSRRQHATLPIIDPPTFGAGRWTETEIRRAHRAYNRGQRDPWAVEGERRYSRLSKRRQRARKAVA